MLKLITQDGRTLNLSRDYHLHIWAIHSDPQKADKVTITLEGDAKLVERRGSVDGKEFTFQSWEHDVKFDAVIGTYPTEVRREKVAQMLRVAWQSDTTQFTMPQNFELVLTEHEAFDDFCEQNHLTQCAINELGYTPQDTARNLHIWRTTNEFERRNILICDEYGDYSMSLAKWQALQQAPWQTPRRTSQAAFKEKTA